MTLEIGKRLREVRRRSGKVIDEIAAETGLSRAYISQVETGKASPSLQTATKLAAALDMSLSALFATDGFETRVTRSSDRQIMMFGTDAPPAERKMIHFLSASDRRLELVLIEIPVGVAAGPPDPGHAGEEAFYVLEGAVRTDIGTQSHTLEAGDSIHWDATLPHSIVNIGAVKARLIFARTPPGFMDIRFTDAESIRVEGEDVS